MHKKKTDRYSLLTSYSMIDGDTSIGITINSSDKTVIQNTPLIKFFNIIKDGNNSICELSISFMLLSNNYSSFTLQLPISMKYDSIPIFVGLTHDDSGNTGGVEDIRFTSKTNSSNSRLNFTITSTYASGNNGFILYIKYLI